MANPESAELHSKPVSAPLELSDRELDFAHVQAGILAQAVRATTLGDLNRKATRDYSEAQQALGDEQALNVVSRMDESDIQSAQDLMRRQTAMAVPDQPERQLAVQSEILHDRALKKVLPELALVELQERLGMIRGGDSIQGITVDQLRNYVDTARDLDSDPMAKMALQYAIRYFDRIGEFNPASRPGTVTMAAVTNGLQRFGRMESSVQDLKTAPDDVKALSYMNDHFSEIEGKAFIGEGICSSSLEYYIGAVLPKNDPARKMVSEIPLRFSDFTWFDPHDGDKLWSKLWLVRGNAQCITRSDIDAGLEQARENPKRIAEMESLFQTWSQ